MKYWDGSRVEAEGADGKERMRRIPLQRAATNERRGQTPLLLRVRRVASLLALAGVTRLAEIAADIGAALAPWPVPKLDSNAGHSSISIVS